MPTCWIIAGPNGAGKTTFALEYLPQMAQCSRFVNADLIAAGLSPLAPEQAIPAASRLFLQEIDTCIKQRVDFAFETTLAGRGYLQRIKRLRADGWRVVLIYLALPSAEMSLMRVTERVAHGGHSIPTADIERRFPRSLHNLFHEFAGVVDSCECFLNLDNQPVPVFEQLDGQQLVIDSVWFDYLLKESLR